MIGDAINTAQSISNFGMLAVTAGFFLVLSAILREDNMRLLKPKIQRV